MPNDPSALPTNLHWLAIADAARLIERRRLSPVELTEALLARIEALDPQLDAFLLPERMNDKENNSDADTGIGDVESRPRMREWHMQIEQ